MSPQTVTLMILIPVAIAGVIALGVFGGRLSAMTRSRVELAFIGLFYPVMVVFWIWRATGAVGAQDWLMTVLAGGFAVMLGVQGVILARKRICAVRTPA